jgi:hypothetical protein
MTHGGAGPVVSLNAGSIIARSGAVKQAAGDSRATRLSCEAASRSAILTLSTRAIEPNALAERYAVPSISPAVHPASRRFSPGVILAIALLPLLIASALLRPVGVARAQGELCFDDQNPAISACISGRFREVWEAGGGLAIFGYPLTSATPMRTAEGTFITQYFERARFELHPENDRPYDVLLGRLGAERLAARGVDWASQPRQAPVAGCRHWAETGFNLCGSMLDAWRSAGLRNGPSAPRGDAASLALWGLPITGELRRDTANGEVIEQWFERARFEVQPSGAIRFGLLGAEMLGATTPVPPVAPVDESADPANDPADESADPPAGPAQEPTVVLTPEPTATPAPPPAPEPTATPAPTLAPPVPAVLFPSIPCNTNVPVPAEGLQVWMANPSPGPAEDAVVCVRLILNGQAVNGAPAITYRYVNNERRASIPQSTGLDGVASFIFYVGNLPAGRVPVEANVTYRGVTYAAWTESSRR